MRLHRLSLRDVKGITERTVDFPEHGVVVLEGPNEVGKTTLLEAFDRLLDPKAKATSQSARVRELQPVGRDVGPWVEAEFTLGGRRIRFAKQWLRTPSTTLEVLSPVREQLSGEQAQARMDQLLAESLDRPLWEALRFAQAGGPAQAGLADSQVLTQALDAATGVDLHAAGGEQLLERVRAEFLRFHTPTGRPGGELRQAMVAHNAAQAEAVEAHGRLEESAALVARHHALRAEHEQLDRTRPALEDAVERAAEAAAALAEVEQAHDQAMLRLQQARERSVHATGAQQARRAAVAEVAAAEQRVAALADALEGGVETLQERQVELQAAAAADEQARQAYERAVAVSELAAADAEHLAEAERLEQLTERAEQLSKVLHDLAQAEALAADQQVSGAMVTRIAEAEHEVRVLRAQADAGAAAVLIEAYDDGASVLLDGSSLRLTAGMVQEHRLDHDLVLELPDQLRITVRAGTADRSLARQVEAAEGVLAAALAEAGVADLSAAHAAAIRSTAAQTAVARLRARREDLLAGLGSAAADLPGELDRLREAVQSFRDERDAELPLPPDIGTARALGRAAREAVEQSRSEAARAAAALRVVDQALAAATTAQEGHRVRLEVERQRHAQLAEALAAARSALSDDAVDQAVAEQQRAYAVVEAQAGHTRRQLAEADPEGVRDRLAAAEADLKRWREQAAVVHDQSVSVAGQVELISGEGRQEAFDQALLALDEARDHLAAVDRRARAARHLHETLNRHRAEAHQAYVRPYATAIEELGRSVYGASFAVDVAPDLTITARHLDGTLVPFDQLSGGAQEQLGILSRLAVAALVDPDQGAPVIIDDALGYTDPERLQRVGAVFAGPAQRAQVILVTCTPERYAAVPGVTTIAMTA